MLFSNQSDEHGTLERIIDSIASRVGPPTERKTEQQTEILQLYKDFIRELKEHAGIEVKTLFPAIHASDDAMHLVAKLSDTS